MESSGQGTHQPVFQSSSQEFRCFQEQYDICMIKARQAYLEQGDAHPVQINVARQRRIHQAMDEGKAALMSREKAFVRSNN